jgi:hypothetical protein
MLGALDDVSEGTNLRPVCGQHGDLVRRVALLQKIAAQLDHQLSLGLIAPAEAVLTLLLLSLNELTTNKHKCYIKKDNSLTYI